MNPHKLSYALLTLLVVALGVLAAPQEALAQLGTRSCPEGTTERKVSGTVLTYDCIGSDGTVVARYDALGRVAASTSCEGTNYWWHFSTCIGRQVAVWIGTLLVSISAWILGLAGILLNASLEFTTIGFDSQIYNRISGGIEAVWTAFRDIANIVIIGMFTFIALTMILGIEKYNARQMVAKILLIAVLINFSLLFTRIIITSSNFVATQFYKAAKFDSEGAQMQIQGAGGNQVSTQFTAGISGKFAQLLGVAGVLDTKTALWKASESADSGWVALLMGLLSAAIFLAVSFVFLYASFLLVARAILFIFLLLTSSLAFASYLIPGGGAIGGYGWSTWWNALLKNAVFAPMLLLLIWATLQVGAGVKSTNGTLGGLLADPGKGGNINALFSYLLILGMLFISIRIASTFANKIGGFNYAAMAPAFGAGFLARAGGFLGRQTFGRGGMALSRTLGAAAKDSERKGQGFRSTLFDLGARGFKQAGKRDFNFMKTQLGEEIRGVSGVKKLDTLAGKDVKGFAGWEEERAKRFAEQAERLKTTDKEKKKIIEDAVKTGMEKRPDIAQRHDAADQVLEQNKRAIQQMTDQQGKAAEELTKSARQLQEAQRQAATGAMNAHDVTRLEKEVKDKEKEITEREVKIEEAQKVSQRATQARTSIRRELMAAAGMTEEDVVRMNRNTDDIAEERAHQRFSNVLSRAFGQKMEDDRFAQEARKQVGEISKKKKRKDLIAELQEELRPSSPPSPPPGPGPTPHP